MAERHPDKKAVIGYFFFSGVSTFLAFFLPSQIWAAFNHRSISSGLPPYSVFFVWNIFLICALFHGKYRLKTLLTDLGLKAAIWKKLVEISFYFSLAALIVLNFTIEASLHS